MTIDLSDEQSAALLAELDRIIDGDRYPLSQRIQTLKEIRVLDQALPGARAGAAATALRAAVEGPLPAPRLK